MSSGDPGLGTGQRLRIHFSVVIPVLRSTAGLAALVGDYHAGLATLQDGFEVVLVPGRDQAAECAQLTRRYECLRLCDPLGPGWGRAVRAGLAASTGEILCYANWERTSAPALLEMLNYARGASDLVLRANRRTRDTRHQRLGSLLFNLECRALLGTTAWDVNGTPKIFSRTRTKLLALSRDDDLLDAEFALVCELEGYPVAEIPIDAQPLPGHETGPDWRRALLMYAGVLSLRRGRLAYQPAARASATP
ncbi:MAG: hypothetical protein ABSH51_10070 [Solirubrobacteraceae bacterium]